MKKAFKIIGVDCANCAAKMENQISKLPGVRACSLSFILQKLVIEADEDQMDEIVTKAGDICRRIDRSAKIIAG